MFTESTLCVPGKQSMKNILVKSFYCKPDRILGNHVFIDQGPGKGLAISEVGVYEETKRKYFSCDLICLISIQFSVYFTKYDKDCNENGKKE